jgi:hypothetical protein
MVPAARAAVETAAAAAIYTTAAAPALGAAHNAKLPAAAWMP